MDANRPVSYDMSHYLGMLRRHWWIIAALTAIGVTGAFAFARTQPKIYESTTTVLVTPTSNLPANAAGGRTNGIINLDTEAQLVTSAEVAADAAKLLKITTPPVDLVPNVTIDVPPNTTVLAITYAANSPAAARAGSHAFATAYLENRQASAEADLNGQISAITSKIKQETDALTKINNDMANLNPGSAKYGNEQSQRQTLTNTINQLTNRANTLSTTAVMAGKIITDAVLPTAPTSPSVPLFVISGAMVGLLLGLAVAFVRQRTDKRVRFAADVPRRSGLPLLAQLPNRVRPRSNDVFPPYGAGGRAFSRLRNEVLASLRDTEKVIVVTGASRGIASTIVATNLASALARAGSEVVLVSAHLPESMVETAPITRMLGVAATPGLSDVLAGKVPLDTATQRAPRNPWLRVITTGGTASATGFLQSQTLREILAELRTQAEYIVIEAPSTANTADAQSLASLADASIVVVELRRTTHLEILDAADQLRRVSNNMLGGVVLPRLGRTADDSPPPPAADRMRATPSVLVPPSGDAQPTAQIDMSAVSASARTRDGVDPRTTTSMTMRLLASRKQKRPQGSRPSPGTPLSEARGAGPNSVDTVIFEVSDPTGTAVVRQGPEPADPPAGGVEAARPSGPAIVTKAGVLNVALPDAGPASAPINPTSITGPVIGARSIVVNPGTGTPTPAEHPPVAPRQQPDPAAKSQVAPTGNGLGMSAVAQTGTGAVRRASPASPAARDSEPKNDAAPLYKRLDLVYVEDGDGEGKAR